MESACRPFCVPIYIVDFQGCVRIARSFPTVFLFLSITEWKREPRRATLHYFKEHLDRERLASVEAAGRGHGTSVLFFCGEIEFAFWASTVFAQSGRSIAYGLKKQK